MVISVLHTYFQKNLKKVFQNIFLIVFPILFSWFLFISSLKFQLFDSPVRSCPSRCLSTSPFRRRPPVFSVPPDSEGNPDGRKYGRGVVDRLFRPPATNSDGRRNGIAANPAVRHPEVRHIGPPAEFASKDPRNSRERWETCV